MINVLRGASYGAALHLFVATLVPASVQAQTVDVGGRAYLDYFYAFSSPDEAEEGLHGFTYRRLYLTTDFQLSDDFRGRARLEANDGTTGSKGPVPFVKDIYLTWAYAGGHSATIGVAPPPAFDISEDAWRYRSLEKTILDFQDIVSSRDFGLRLDGPITSGGTLRYAAMVANNSASSPETDPYKRLYLQLAAFPSDQLTFTAGMDHAGYAEPLESSTRLSGFAGYAAEAFTLGLEGYWSNLTFDTGNEAVNVGLSLFGSIRVSSTWEIVGRIDRAKDDLPDTGRFETLVLGGVAYSPNEFVRLIPNIWLFKIDDVPRDEMLGRMTVELRF